MGKPHEFPVSIKGVAVQHGRVLLLENERAEWELPGGKLELGEDPALCVVRQIQEEAQWISNEHKRAGLFGYDEVAGLPMPEGYKRSIAAWFSPGRRR
jgi:ADP-ribose pyrophosphatase YjhB (NUDIX family)